MEILEQIRSEAKSYWSNLFDGKFFNRHWILCSLCIKSILHTTWYLPIWSCSIFRNAERKTPGYEVLKGRGSYTIKRVIR